MRLLILSLFLSPNLFAAADLVLFNGKVITMEKKSPRAEAVAIFQDRIIAVGSNRDVLKLADEKTRRIDLGNRVLVPGLIDSHVHLSGLGFTRQELSLLDTKSEREIADRVAARAKETPKGKWILGAQWNQNLWPEKKFPESQMLSLASQNHPVFLTRIDGHAAWVNERALEIAGISKNTPDPDGGKILRNAAGDPTGVLIDKAMSLVGKNIPDPSKEEVRAAVERTFLEISAAGLTSIHNAGTSRVELEVFRELAQQNKLPFRIYALLSGRDEKLLAEYFAQGPEIGSYSSYLTIRSVKVFADGALGSRGAALLHPYHDDQKNQGLLLVKEEALYKLSLGALKANFQIATHAIGDDANRRVLNVYEKAMRDYPTFAKPRFRVEHAQVVDPRDIPRFASLGVIPSMQATHATSDMTWVHSRIGEKLARDGAYAWRSFLKNGSRIANGSDAPVESIAPMLGFYAAVTRKDLHGSPAKGWHPEQKMTREEALRSFTIDPSFAAFEENEKGSIAVGKLADLTLLSQDIMTLPAEKIPSTEVLLTITGGKIVYENRPLSVERTTN